MKEKSRKPNTPPKNACDQHAVSGSKTPPSLLESTKYYERGSNIPTQKKAPPMPSVKTPKKD